MSLPLKYKLSLRDHWEDSRAPAAKALQHLRDVLGVTVTCTPEWPILVNELRSAYEKKGIDPVVSIVGLIRGLCEAASELADDESESGWADALWEKLGAGPRNLQLFIDVSAQSSDRAHATWEGQRGGFVLAVPKVAIALPNEHIPAIKEQLRTTFDKSLTSAQVVETETAPGVDLSLQSSKTTARKPVHYLPDAAALPRPDELLQAPPYHLIIRAIGETLINIECSHGPSLDVLAAYLKRWCRTNHNLSTKPPVVEVRLEPGSFGAGMLHDKLTLRTDDSRHHVSPTLILHFAESVLGYEKVYTDSNCWQFRRDTHLKKV